MGPDERECRAGPLRLPAHAGGEGTPPPDTRTGERGEDDERAGHGHRRVRSQVPRAVAEAVSTQRGDGEAVSEPARHGGDDRETELEPAGGLPDHGGASAG